jgi:WS/DGAT/MGAT family acyltransferase
VHSQRLDRSKPLWETWLVQGLERNRFALISKNHHALVDGVSGVDLATVLFDVQPVPVRVAHSGIPWTPRPTPSGLDLAARGVRGVIGLPFDAAARAIAAAARPSDALHVTREAMEGLGEVVWAGLNPAPATPLNVEIGPHRRMLWVRHGLADFKRVKDAFGGTVNDVVLTVVAGALQKWLRSRGVRTEGLELRALVPVSIRVSSDRGSLGNRIAAMRAPLPVYVEDPVARLEVVRHAMDGLKDSKQALGAEVLAGMQALAPPTVFAQASRLNFSTRLFNLLVTNVPGPQFPLYMLGRRMQDLFPVAFLPKRHALAVAIMSYDGGMNFGLLGDYDAMPDLDRVAEMLDASLEELLEAAGPVERNGNGSARVSSRARTSRPRTSSQASKEG